MQPLDAGEPRTIGPYRLLGRLGAGGMGRVYLARSEGGRTVAVKVVHPHFAMDEEFRARFRREVDSARRVGTGPGGHRWSAPVLDADPEAAVPWVATGYVAGPSLTQAVQGHGPLPAQTVRALGAGLAEALAGVHALGLVHRDVKPSNVLLALDGPRLIDFGIARATDGTASLTSTGVSVGSPGYMSPEQILGKGVTGAADVFSLGAVLAYGATGASPFPGDSSAALLYRVVHEEPDLSALTGEGLAGLRETVARCLAKDPAARPAPQEVAALLAPQGAAGAVAAGWLPGPLVEEVSRAVVQLLDLEPSAPAPTGLVPFTNDSLQGPGQGTGNGSGNGSGGFGTAPPLGVFGDPVEPLPDPRRPDRAVSFSFEAGAGAGTRTNGQGPHGAPPAPAAARPRRRVSCTVALAVAGALAAVMVGGGFLAGIMPGQGDDRDTTADHGSVGGGQKTSEPAATGGPSAPGGPAPSPGDSGPAGSAGPSTSPDPAETPAPTGGSELPKTFVGTWSGPTVESGGLPHGDYLVKFSKGAVGTDVVRTTSSFSLLGTTVHCYGIGKLVSATDTLLRVDERPDPDRPGDADLCTSSGAAPLTFTLTRAGSLRYESKEEAAGNPSGTLTRQ